MPSPTPDINIVQATTKDDIEQSRRLFRAA